MRKYIVKIVIILMALMVILSNCTVLASNVKSMFNGDTSKVSGAVSATQTVLGTILDVTRLVGIGVAVIILSYLGIKFMLASPSERANIKQYSMNFVIGAFILIGGVGILTIVKKFAVKINA